MTKFADEFADFPHLPHYFSPSLTRRPHRRENTTLRDDHIARRALQRAQRPPAGLHDVTLSMREGARG